MLSIIVLANANVDFTNFILKHFNFCIRALFTFKYYDMEITQFATWEHMESTLFFFNWKAVITCSVFIYFM